MLTATEQARQRAYDAARLTPGEYESKYGKTDPLIGSNVETERLALRKALTGTLIFDDEDEWLAFQTLNRRVGAQQLRKAALSLREFLNTWEAMRGVTCEVNLEEDGIATLSMPSEEGEAYFERMMNDLVRDLRESGFVASIAADRSGVLVPMTEQSLSKAAKRDLSKLRMKKVLVRNKTTGRVYLTTVYVRHNPALNTAVTTTKFGEDEEIEIMDDVTAEDDWQADARFIPGDTVQTQDDLVYTVQRIDKVLNINTGKEYMVYELQDDEGNTRRAPEDQLKFVNGQDKPYYRVHVLEPGEDGFPTDLSKLKGSKQVDGGTLLTDPATGYKYISKVYADPAVAKSEFTANSLATALGLATVPQKMYGQDTILSRYFGDELEPLTQDPKSIKLRKKMQADFAILALLANTDIAKSDEAIQVDENDNLVYTTLGGSLYYRMRGTEKAGLGDDVSADIDALRQANKNYGLLTDENIANQIRNLTYPGSPFAEQFEKALKGLPFEMRRKMQARWDSLSDWEAAFRAKNFKQDIRTDATPPTAAEYGTYDGELNGAEVQNAVMANIAKANPNARKDYLAKLMRSGSFGSEGWAALSAIAKLRKADARPVVMANDAWDQMVENDKDRFITLFRGVKHQGKDSLVQDEVCFFGTVGVHGAGIYAAMDGTKETKRNKINRKSNRAYEEAANYGDARIFHIAIDTKEAKIGSKKDIREVAKSILDSETTEITAAKTALRQHAEETAAVHLEYQQALAEAVAEAKKQNGAEEVETWLSDVVKESGDTLLNKLKDLTTLAGGTFTEGPKGKGFTMSVGGQTYSFKDNVKALTGAFVNYQRVFTKKLAGKMVLKTKLVDNEIGKFFKETFVKAMTQQAEQAAMQSPKVKAVQTKVDAVNATQKGLQEALDNAKAAAGTKSHPDAIVDIAQRSLTDDQYLGMIASYAGYDAYRAYTTGTDRMDYWVILNRRKMLIRETT